MTFKLLILTYKQEGVTPEQYRDQCENVVIPLLKDIVGEHFPISHTRHYIQHVAGVDIGCDGIAELVFADKKAFEAYIGIVMQPENAARIAAVEDKLMDGSKRSIVSVDGSEVTLKP